MKNTLLIALAIFTFWNNASGGESSTLYEVENENRINGATFNNGLLEVILENYRIHRNGIDKAWVIRLNPSDWEEESRTTLWTRVDQRHVGPNLQFAREVLHFAPGFTSGNYTLVKIQRWDHQERRMVPHLAFYTHHDGWLHTRNLEQVGFLIEREEEGRHFGFEKFSSESDIEFISGYPRDRQLAVLTHGDNYLFVTDERIVCVPKAEVSAILTPPRLAIENQGGGKFVVSWDHPREWRLLISHDHRSLKWQSASEQNDGEQSVTFDSRGYKMALFRLVRQ